MTHRRPSIHIRRVRTKHGRRARLINPHLRRVRIMRRRQRSLSKAAKFGNLMDKYDSLVKIEANRRNRLHGEKEEFPEITDVDKKQRAAARAVVQAMARSVRLSVPPPWKAKDYNEYLMDVAAQEGRDYDLKPPRTFVAVPHPPHPPLPWYGLKVAVRKQRRWTPGRRRMRVPEDTLDPEITKALEKGASLREVEPMIEAQVAREAWGPHGKPQRRALS